MNEIVELAFQKNIVIHIKPFSRRVPFIVLRVRVLTSHPTCQEFAKLHSGQNHGKEL